MAYVNSLIGRFKFSTILKLSSHYKQLQSEKNVPFKRVAHKQLNKNYNLNLEKNCCFIKKLEHNLNFSVTNLYQSRKVKGAGFHEY